jgi:hypothetical protein
MALCVGFRLMFERIFCMRSGLRKGSNTSQTRTGVVITFWYFFMLVRKISATFQVVSMFAVLGAIQSISIIHHIFAAMPSTLTSVSQRQTVLLPVVAF